jgi:hypothetical protein
MILLYKMKLNHIYHVPFSLILQVQSPQVPINIWKRTQYNVSHIYGIAKENLCKKTLGNCFVTFFNFFIMIPKQVPWGFLLGIMVKDI